MNRDVCEHFVPTDLPCEKCTEKRKSEALFLADELTIPLGTVIGSEVYRRAAAELRRLHEENERCREVCKATSECWRADAAEWQAQRDALLEALKFVIRGVPDTWEGVQKARAAIAKAEEKA